MKTEVDDRVSKEDVEVGRNVDPLLVVYHSCWLIVLIVS